MTVYVGGPSAEERTFKVLQDEVLDHGFDANVYRGRVKRWLNDGLRRLQRRLEIGDNQSEATIDAAIGVSSYPLPADFVRIAREDTSGGLRVVLAGGADAPVREVTLGEIDARDETERGQPVFFALTAASLVVWPTPDAAVTLKLRYWSGPPTMVADTDVPDLPDEFAELLVSYALARAYKSEDDFEASAFHQQEWERDLVRMGTDTQYRSRGPKQVEGMLAVWGDDR